MAAGAMAAGAMAAPAQCDVTGYGTFDCDVALDGGGLTFGLPDGQTFAFAPTEAGVGSVYLIAAEARPGQQPDALGEFRAVADEPGCWARDEDYRFCVQLKE